MIGIIDYHAGNTRSVHNALGAIGIESLLTSDPRDLQQCSGVILPGVGSAGTAMRMLEQRGFSDWIRRTERPFLGICLGLQLLYEFSDEGGVKSLGLISGSVRSLRELGATERIPHMGWNQVKQLRPSPLLAAIEDEAHFYFAHSYAAIHDEATVAVSDGFGAVVQKNNFFGVQFHPEKSASIGLQLLKNFEGLCRSSLPWI